MKHSNLRLRFNPSEVLTIRSSIHDSSVSLSTQNKVEPIAGSKNPLIKDELIDSDFEP